jgi:acid phosphatase type 7
VINDTHENKGTLEAVTRSLAESPVDFLVWNGDVFQDIYTDEQIVAQALRPAGAAYAATTPVLFVSGNHDVRGPEARRLPLAFTHWKSEEPLGRCFALRHGPLALIGMDTGEDKPDAHPVFAGLAAFEPYRQAQREWLAGVLRRPEIATAPFLVMCCHIPINGLPGDNAGDTMEGYARFMGQGQRLWGPLLSEAGAQVVISGHTHRFRYDPPEGKRGYGQLVGGAPAPEWATLIRARVAQDKLELAAHKMDGSLWDQWVFKPRK